MERKIDEYSYHLGAADAFCEMVRAGVKRIALSHPCDTKEMRDGFLSDFDMLCVEYGTHYYVEDEPIITDLFPAEMNRGKFQVIFYREEKDINAYLALKEEIRRSKADGTYGEVRKEIAELYGRLLSYPKERVEFLMGINKDLF